ncbi:MAG: hypothetical protein HY232_19295 [Acidobacteria bacterium]|nr:hypothetical protein [Acidobacteriota bacterium]
MKKAKTLEEITFVIDQFKDKIESYLSGRLSWGDLHHWVLILYTEEDTKLDFSPPYTDILGEIVAALLIDERDDPQFRVTDEEVKSWLNELGKIEADIKLEGFDTVRQKYEHRAKQREQDVRIRYTKRHLRKQTKKDRLGPREGKLDA